MDRQDKKLQSVRFTNKNFDNSTRSVMIINDSKIDEKGKGHRMVDALKHFNS